MNAARAGREGRFLSLLGQHEKILYKVAHAYCRSAADRDDLVQEMIAALWRSFDRYDERQRFSTWLYRVALNVAISSYRREKRRQDNIAEVDPASLDIAESAGERSEPLERLSDFIVGLGDIDKALMLLYLESYTYEEIATTLGLSETNVATKLSRIKGQREPPSTEAILRLRETQHDDR